jgi:23S rRNA pseudouridine2605 synthase
MCEAVGHPVLELERVRFGPLADESLRPGQARALEPEEVERLREGSVARPTEQQL